MRKFLQQANESFNAAGAVFLGGTCNGSKWRDLFIPLLTGLYFNPVVDDWTEAFIEIENKAKEEASIMLFVITPKQKGFYSIAEVAIAATAGKKKVVLVFLNDDDGVVFDEHQVKSNNAIKNLLSTNSNLSIFDTLADAALYINAYSGGTGG